MADGAVNLLRTDTRRDPYDRDISTWMTRSVPSSSTACRPLWTNRAERRSLCRPAGRTVRLSPGHDRGGAGS